MVLIIVFLQWMSFKFTNSIIKPRCQNHQTIWGSEIENVLITQVNF